MNTTTTKMGRMSPRQWKDLDPAKLNERFGLHLQGLMEAAGLTVADLRMKLARHDFAFTEAAIRHWMRGDHTPSLDAMAALGKIFGLSDYRHVLPQPQKPRE
jgi:hypothetical protein